MPKSKYNYPEQNWLIEELKRRSIGKIAKELRIPTASLSGFMKQHHLKGNTARSPKVKILLSEIDTISIIQIKLMKHYTEIKYLKDYTNYPILDYLAESFDEVFVNIKNDIETREKQIQMLKYGQKLQNEEKA